MDQMVLATQKWLNKNYNGKISKLEEDGITGWGTITALTKALQIELGVDADGLWGQGTEKECPTISSNNDNTNIITILQCGLYCKGYDGGNIDGNFTSRTAEGISNLRKDAGLSDTSGTATPLIFKALLSTMDGFVLANRGDSNVRKIQQNLNRDYYMVIGLIPCNGVYSRETNRALIKALQHEEGVGADGIWGNNTMNLCPTIPGSRSNKRFVLLLQYSLYVNGVDPHGFDGLFGSGLSNAIKEFQRFCVLPDDGYAGKQVWASLLVSTGDRNRKGTACDCSTSITPAMAVNLKSNGYKIVGRYLTGRYRMTSSELKTIFDNGLKVVPIFEVGGYRLDYFNYNQGIADAHSAMLTSTNLGFGKDTIIYFAVDFDALDYNVTNNILPYFKAINEVFNGYGNKYKIGIYAPRNVCSRVANAGYSCSSFVCDMSTGFSGNLGYPLPKDWAFDQISTITLHGAAEIEIDNNIASGRNVGVGGVTPIVDILKIANNNSFAKLLGLEFSSPDGEIVLIDTGCMKISLGLSMSSALGDGNTTIKFKEGKFDGIGLQTAIKNIQEGLSKNGSIELSNTIAKLSTMELAIKVSSKGDNLKIDIQNTFNAEISKEPAEKISLSETLSIEFRIDPKKVKEEVSSAVDSVIDLVKEHPAIGVITVIAIIAAIVFLGADLSVGAIISGIIEGLTSIVVFVVTFLSQLTSKLA